MMLLKKLPHYLCPAVAAILLTMAAITRSLSYLS